MSKILEVVQAPLNQNIPDITSGDSVSVSVKIKEGDRERVQEFKGVIIAIRRKGLHETFTVRRIATNGIGVERTYPFFSPLLDKVEVLRLGKVRRAKLYYLRGLTGKAARIKASSQWKYDDRPAMSVPSEIVPIAAAEEEEVLEEAVEEGSLNAEAEDVTATPDADETPSAELAETDADSADQAEQEPTAEAAEPEEIPDDTKAD